MKNILKAFYVLVIFITFVACNQEDIINDIVHVEIDESTSETFLIDEKIIEITDDSKNELEPIEDIKSDNVILDEESSKRQQEFSSENMVIIGELSLYVDVYELSITEYCKVFPDYRDVLIERVRERNNDWGLRSSTGNYPAFLTYDETVEYAERVSKRFPTMNEWKFIAIGDNNKGKGNLIQGNFVCKLADAQLFHVNESKIANGYGVYEMTGNVSEWCQSIEDVPYVSAGVHWTQCEILIENWYPFYVEVAESKNAARLVRDIN